MNFSFVPDPAVSVSAVARASGQDRSRIRRQLADVPPYRRVETPGKLAEAFHVAKLPPELREKIDPYDLSALAEIVATWKNVHRPTDSEQCRLLDCAFLKLDSLQAQGAALRPMKARILHWIVEHAPALAPNYNALRSAFNRLFARWQAGGKRLAAIRDQRPQAAKERRAPKLPQADLDRLAATAVIKYGGRLDSAWRQCWPELSPEIRQRYPQRREVPRNVREQVMPEIRRMLPEHVGPRAARLNGCYLERDWSHVFAGDWYSSDDVTLPVYCYDPERPRELLRGQFLPMIDVKSERILDFAFEVSKSYTAATIRSLISQVCSRFGMPRRGFHFERGIWKTAKLLGGGAMIDPMEECVETFADRLGLRIMHSLPGNARAKVVERVAGILQNMMEGEPGYVGRDEMGVKYERVQAAKRDVESGRLHPEAAGFRSVDKWILRLAELCDSYNSAERTSEVMGGTLAPDEAWRTRQALNAAGEIEPLVKLPAELRYLLASHKESVRVTRAGIALFNGKFRYASEVTGRLKGEMVVVWFDPDHPETLAITDLNGENLQTIPRLMPIPAFDAWERTPELARESTAAVNAHNGYARRCYSELSAKYYPPTRLVLTDVASVDKGREMGRQRADLTERSRKRSVSEQAAEEGARKRELSERLEAANRFEAENTLAFL